MTTAELQRALKALGFDPGKVDGFNGPRTRAAVRAFQKSARITVDGIVGPQTLAALAKRMKVPAAKEVTLPWLAELLRRKGLMETDPVLKKWLKSDGKTLGDPSKLPWCGDAVETAIALTLPDEPIPTNPYLARNWLKFGKAVEPETFGAVGVFSRPGSAVSGHVGFIFGWTKTHFRVAGGNQSNAVTDNALLARGRLLGARWPTLFPFVRLAPGPAGAGVISTNEA